MNRRSVFNRANSAVPPELRLIVVARLPSDEALGYFQMSLQDNNRRRNSQRQCIAKMRPDRVGLIPGETSVNGQASNLYWCSCR